MTGKQKQFCEYYIANGCNGHKAALEAGYSKKTAQAIATENLQKPIIKKEINRLIKEKLSDVDMAAYELIRDLDEIRNADIGDYAEIKEEETQDGITIKKVDFKPTKDLNTKVISEIATTQSGLKIKMYDKLKAIELKGKYLSLWSDTLSVVKPEKEEVLSREERKQRIIELTNKMGK